jgi:putative ABC transport system substrate-binding protein
MRRLGVLFGLPEGDPQAVANAAAFTKALQELGWIEGQNARIDYRWAGTNPDQMRAFAKELVGLQPDVILGHTTLAVAALQRETKTIPIVFVVVSDPVGSGFVASLPRPGGNITGFINLEASLSGKWIEILKEIMPELKHAVLMFNPGTASYFRYFLQPFEAAALSLAIEPIAAPVHTAADIERILASLQDKPNTGLVVMPDTYLAMRQNLHMIISLAAGYRVPAIYPFRYMITAGGLISYGIDQVDLFRRAPTYIDRILKGANPADLPVQLPIKFEMIVNLKTAKTLGIYIPATLLGRADEVIE